jgi:hypothetical protein
VADGDRPGVGERGSMNEAHREVTDLRSVAGFIEQRILATTETFPYSQRLSAVARSDPWTTPPAQVGISGDVTRRRRLPWVVGPHLSANYTDEGWLYPKSLHRNTFNSNRAWLSRLFGIG